MYSIFEQLLQKYGISAYKVSKDTGIAQSVFSSWKNGISNPKTDKLKVIADYFHVSLNYLMTGHDQEETNELEAKNKTERDILLLCRSLDDAPDDDKEELVDTIKRTIDIYKKAKGLK